MTAALIVVLAFVTAPPGGPAAWGAGGALLADPEGALAVFDQPARLGTGTSLGATRARLFELDALVRTRVGVAFARGGTTAALGAETFGPPGFESRRIALGVARATGARAAGVAASASRLAAGGAVRWGASFDAGATAAFQALGGTLRAGGAARSLLVGGDPAAVADADWTAELALEHGLFTAHVARTRDLAGARSGAGVSLTAAGVRVSAGAIGPPVQWTLGIDLAPRPGAHAGFARIEHPELGASDVIGGSVSW